MTTEHHIEAEEKSPGADVSIRFEGRSVRAKEGQSIAGALHAAQKRTLSRGVKYHTPRGYTCGFGACGDCPLTVDGIPGTLSCVTPVREGQVVSRELGLPTTGFDLLRAADLMRPFLGAGFQFHLFAKQPRLSKLAGSLLAVLAGGGRMPTRSAANSAKVTRVDRYETAVAVIGGGVSGLAAALTASNTGARVTVIDRDFLGGRSAVRTEPVTDRGQRLELRATHARLLELARADARITLLAGIAIGWVDGLLPVVSGTLRSEIRPARVVIATGSYETPLLFPNHDRPGVMFADAALKLADVESVAPGSTAVVISDDDRSDAVVERLHASGVHVGDVVAAERVQRVLGWGRARGIVVSGGSPGKTARRIRADLVVVVGPRRPADELALQVAYDEAGTHERVDSDHVELDSSVVRVGSSTGTSAYSLESVRDAVSDLLTKVPFAVRSSPPDPQ